ncbi:unnamed protein product [Rotaria magnacalcarata]|uniref:Uncharacterized protein n=1 Tax=Rotaria magnacalcarata TaxID=392030 RepID=A0A816XDK1_9BILA|nr:unnamed protein product [Rotaria magnacalcarata]
MKSTKIALLIVFIIIAGVAFSQTNTTYKLLTYSRSITGGAQQVDENGKAIDNIRYQYDVFLETSGKTKPIITAFWIKGQPYQVQIVPVKKLPVTLLIEKRKIVLVKQSAQFVWQLLLTPDSSKKSLQTNTYKDLQLNEVVCKLKGNTKNILLKKITELPAIITE